VKRYQNILEHVLVEKLKSGDPDSFSQFFSAYYKDLVLFAYSFTHDLQDAEDIVQDTFIRLWEDRENLIVTTSLKSILLKTIHNKCIDWHRHRKIKDTHSSYIIDNSPLYECDTDNYILSSELENRIEKAISVLPEKYKESFQMNRFEGLKYKDIAVRLNVSVRTVEVRISKALELLRKSLIDFV